MYYALIVVMVIILLAVPQELPAQAPLARKGKLAHIPRCAILRATGKLLSILVRWLAAEANLLVQLGFLKNIPVPHLVHLLRWGWLWKFAIIPTPPIIQPPSGKPVQLIVIS
jgi:hypothetical protein